MRNGNLKFVDGLSERFECVVTDSLKKLLSHKQTDEYLRGLRYLPFESGQKDMLASYLAKRTTCIFRELDKENYKVFIDRSNLKKDSFLTDVFAMIENYLDQFREIEIVVDKNRANVTLFSKSIRVNDDLIQVWVSTGQQRIGASVEAYVKKKL